MARGLAIIFALLATPVVAESEQPMRPAAMEIITTKPMDEVRACVTRRVEHNGRAVVVPVKGGVEIDQLTITLLTKPQDARFRFRVVDEGNRRLVSAFYRHPVAERTIERRLRDISDQCGVEQPTPVATPSEKK